MLFEILLVAFLVRFVWRKVATTSATFLQSFGSLLERPQHGRPGMLKQLAGADYVGGEFRGRPVAVLLQAKRGQRLGYLVVGMATGSGQQWQVTKRTSAANLLSTLVHSRAADDHSDLQLTIGGGEPAAARLWMARPEVRQALHALVDRHDLSVSLEGGWLRVTWRPIGLFIFPGRFEEPKWSEVLACMHTLASTLEPTHATRAASSSFSHPHATTAHA